MHEKRQVFCYPHSQNTTVKLAEKQLINNLFGEVLSRANFKTDILKAPCPGNGEWIRS